MDPGRNYSLELTRQGETLIACTVESILEKNESRRNNVAWFLIVREERGLPGHKDKENSHQSTALMAMLFCVD